MRNVGKYPKCFMLLSFFLVIAALLVWSGVGFAIENPAGTTINNTLTGDPNCINYGTIDTNTDNRHGMSVEEKDEDGVSHYASNFGNVITHGLYAYGMYANLGAIATNKSEGTITTHGEQAHGMYAYDNSTVMNNGSIETNGYLAYGMYTLNGSTAINNGRIITRGNYASGMEAWDIATAINYGSIETNGNYALGMRAGDNANAINFGSIETNGIGAYGMLVNTGAIANHGSIITHGQDAFGMYANSYSTATNSGSITTEGEKACGIYAHGLDSTVTNNSGGTITTYGSEGLGMRAEDNANAINNGSIETNGYYARGMSAFNCSTAINNGRIITRGNYAYGMEPWTIATAINNGSIETNGDYALGMRAGDNANAINNGSIETNGIGAYGMLVDPGEIANNGSIITHGQDAFGMYANSYSTATNSGRIETNGYLAYGMHARYGSTATNESGGTITTYGDGAFGVLAGYDSTATNRGTITTGKEDDPTCGTRAYGMYAYQDSTAENFGSITTFGQRASGMYAEYDSTATNKIGGDIVTYGIEAHGMVASSYWDGSNWHPSGATNEGSIITHGKMAFGINAGHSRNIMNSGDITTYGGMAHGIYVETGPEVINSGTITVTGEGADAVNIRGSTFTNSGTLDSLRGNAITSVNSTVTLEDGTKLPNSHNIVGDDGSTLNVNMAGDLAAIVNFGTFNKNGTGTLTLEEGSSAGTTNNNAGTLKIAPDTTFETNSYTQTAEARLHLYVPSNSDVGLPLKINNEGGTAAQFAGKVVIDYSSQPLPGMYKYIYVAGERSNDFDSVSFVNPGGIYKTFMPQWVPGNSFYYTSIVGYAFSEQALGLVSAIEDWSLLRWIMANHLQDVVSEMDNLETGKKVYYAHFLANKTDRNPTGGSPLGYESDTRGLSFGFDKKTDDRTVWGIYAGYTEKDIDFTDVVPASSDWEEQDSWYIGAYMSKRFDKWIISDTLTYRSTDHDSFRRQKDGDARASFDSWAVTNDIRAGYVVKEIGKDSHWEIVPEVGLNVGYFNRDGYKETNGYTYGDYDTTVTEGVIGVRFKGEFISKDGSRFSPYLRLSYVNVLSGDDVTIDEIRYGNKSWFTEKLDDDYFAADLGMTLYSAGNFDMSLNYNGRFGDDSESHGGWLRLEWKQ